MFHVFTAMSLRLMILLLCLLSLSACERGTAPNASHIYAAAGLFGGALNTDGSRAIVGSIYHGGSLWDSVEHERLFNWNHKSGEQTQITTAAFSPDGLFAATASPQTMVLWDAQQGSAISYWTSPSEIHAMDLLPQGNLAVLAMEDFTAALFDSRRGGVRQTYRHDNRVNSVKANAERDLVLTGSDDTSARLWRLSSAELLYQWDHDNEVQLVQLSPDGSLALTVSQYDKASLWSTDSGEKLSDIPFRPTALARGISITTAVFSDDNQQLAIGLTNRLVKLIDIDSMATVKTWRMPKRIKAQPSNATAIALAFSPDRHLLALMSDGFLHQLP